MTLLAALCALAAMVLFGVASVLQAVATRRAEVTAVLDPRLLLALARQPLFLAALLLNVVGFLLHVAALQWLPLFLVQAVIAGSVAVTALLCMCVFRTPLGRAQRVAVGLVVIGLAMVAPAAQAGEVPAGSGERAAALLAAVGAVALAALAVRRVDGALGTVLLGLLAGTGFGVVALAARLLPELGPGLLTAPTTAVLAVAGATAYLLYSAAMQRGSVTTATAAMVVTQTVVPAVAGLLLGDRVRPGLVPVAALGMTLAVLGAVALARYEERPQPAGDLLPQDARPGVGAQPTR